jgi:GNAT superfamily N-acetyltransferase
MRGSVSVRALAAHEWPLLRELRLAALADAPDAFGRTYEQERPLPDTFWERQLAATVASPSAISAVADRDGCAVGIVYAALPPDEPGTARLYSMWVAPAARGAGAGDALVAAIVAWARSRGAKRLVLDVTQGNAAAERLYERSGLRYTGATVPLRESSPLRARTMEITL